MKVTVGILLITYKGSRDEQPIRWVRLSDANSLQQFVTSGAEQTERAERIGAEITRLRSVGVTDKQLKAAGIDVDLFNQLSTTRKPWPLTSYNLTTSFGRTGISFHRVHQLEWHKIDRLRLVNRREVHD